MKIACVILHYRILEDTAACLDSLRKSGIPGWKIFLVNNSGSDGSGAELTKRLESVGCDFAHLDPGFNSGFAGGCNLGAAAALKEGFTHVILLNSDTEVAPDFRSAVEASVSSFPEDVLAGNVTDEQGCPTHNVGRFSPWTGRVRHILDLNVTGPIDFVSGCLMIVPGKTIEGMGLFDESLFMYGEDADFCLRLKAGKRHVRMMPAIRIRHKFDSLLSRSNFPKEYYIIRNQTRTIYLRGSLVQKIGYSVWLLAMPAYKILFRPRLFTQALQGAWDGVLGRTGVRRLNSE
jgi:GT2 family glycosyltransferase